MTRRGNSAWLSDKDVRVEGLRHVSCRKFIRLGGEKQKVLKGRSGLELCSRFLPADQAEELVKRLEEDFRSRTRRGVFKCTDCVMVHPDVFRENLMLKILDFINEGEGILPISHHLKGR